MVLFSLLFWNFLLSCLAYSYQVTEYKNLTIPQPPSYGSFTKSPMLLNRCSQRNKFTIAITFNSPPLTDVFVSLSRNPNRVPSYTVIPGVYSKISSIICYASSKVGEESWLRKINTFTNMTADSIQYLEYNAGKISVGKKTSDQDMQKIDFPSSVDVNPAFIYISQWYGPLDLKSVTISCATGLF
ncbi:hypothetical protein BB560_007308 [Smittium megazygosporum]|uniref:Uncharacterized protein n=1 Tax=Smittium megazygosporum TaxID=133381 RepID=A0A2T9XWX7_9FUNG|nr:hypothetical protein BB560_007308 [Smittium megazygosporum]